MSAIEEEEAMLWWIVLLFAIIGYFHGGNWWGALDGAVAGAVIGLLYFAVLMRKRRCVLANWEEQERGNREAISLLMQRRERGEGWSPELEHKFQDMMQERRQRRLWPFKQE
jgi:hypothetical protein